MIRLLGAVCVLAVITGVSLTGADRAASQTTALQVTTTGTPQRVHGTDGREHIEYNLVITNSFTAEVTLTSLTVRGNGEELLTLSGDALAEFTHPSALGPPTTSIPSSSAVATLVDVVLPRSAGRTAPKQVQQPNRLHASRRRTPRSDHRGQGRPRAGPPRRSARPDRDRPAASRRRLGLRQRVLPRPDGQPSLVDPVGGRELRGAETFAVDYIRIVDGRFYAGDGTQNTDWFGYGVPIRSVADGKVVSAVDGRPEVPRSSSTTPPSPLRRTSAATGSW